MTNALTSIPVSDLEQIAGGTSLRSAAVRRLIASVVGGPVHMLQRTKFAQTMAPGVFEATGSFSRKGVGIPASSSFSATWNSLTRRAGNLNAPGLAAE